MYHLYYKVHWTQCGKRKNLVSPKNISWNQLFSNFYSKNVTFKTFLPKICETKSQQFPHCAEVSDFWSYYFITKIPWNQLFCWSIQGRLIWRNFRQFGEIFITSLETFCQIVHQMSLHHLWRRLQLSIWRNIWKYFEKS